MEKLGLLNWLRQGDKDLNALPFLNSGNFVQLNGRVVGYTHVDKVKRLLHSSLIGT